MDASSLCLTNTKTKSPYTFQMESLTFPMSPNIPPCQLLFLIWTRTHPETEVRRPGSWQKILMQENGDYEQHIWWPGEAAVLLKRTIHASNRFSTNQLSVMVWSHAHFIIQMFRTSHLKRYNQFTLPIKPHPSFLPMAKLMSSSCFISTANLKLWGMPEPKRLNKTNEYT